MKEVEQREQRRTKKCNEKIAANSEKKVARTVRRSKNKNSYEKKLASTATKKTSEHSNKIEASKATKKQQKKTMIRCNEKKSERLEWQRELTKLYFYSSK